MIRFEKHFFINQTPQKVFEYLTDPTYYAEWQASTKSAILTSRGPLGAGSTIRVTGSVLGRKIEVELVVTTYDPPRQYSFRTTSGPAKGEMDHHLTAEGNGTKLTVAGKLEIGGFLENLAARQMETRVEEDARQMKARLEAR